MPARDERVRSIAGRLADLAASDPGGAALVGFDRALRTHRLTWTGLVERTATLAAEVARRCPPGVLVATPAGNTLDAVVRILAVLSAERAVLPLNPRAPGSEIERLLTGVRRQEAVALLDADGLTVAPGTPRSAAGGAGLLLTTGGSSRHVRVVAFRSGLRYDPAWSPDPLHRYTGWRVGQRQLIVAPLHHTAPLTMLVSAVLDANEVVLQPTFWPQWTMELIERHAVEWMQLAPSHMRACVQLGRPRPEQCSSLRALLHTAAPCDAATKRAWIDLLGPEKVFELYAATEDVGATVIRGDDWLEHPGSVGRGFFTKIRILDDDGTPVPTGVQGRVFMRRATRRRVNTYLDGRAMEATADGFVSVGDHGRLDEDGYLYLAPRRLDMINVGGENVYPAELEAVFLESPEVADVVAVPVPDDTLGASIQLQVVARDPASATAGSVIAFGRERLAPHKTPGSVVFVDEVPRSGTGKIERWRARPVRTVINTDSQEDG
jgi:bile acid-coenzyme A ligase